MAVFGDTFLILGAIFGVFSVYLAPFTIGSDLTHNKMKKKNYTNRSPTFIPDLPSKLINSGTSQKYYGDSTLNDVLGRIKTEISKLLSAEKWTIIVPKEKILDASFNFQNSRNEFITESSEIALDSIDNNNILNSTEYKDIPDIFLSASNSKGNKKNNKRKLYKGINCLGFPQDDKYFIRLPRQSTFINTKSKKNPEFIVLGDNNIEELETFATDSGYSVITVENEKIEFSLRKSKSPINRIFKDVKDFLSFKRRLHTKNNNNLPNNFSSLINRNNNFNITT